MSDRVNLSTGDAAVVIPQHPDPGVLDWSDAEKAAITAIVLADRATRSTYSSAEAAWRCFHCDATFTDRDSAREHFGASEVSDPACFLSPKHYRQLETVLNRWTAQGQSDAEEAQDRLDRCREGKHIEARIRAEEQGYAQGLADGRAEAANLTTAPHTKCS